MNTELDRTDKAIGAYKIAFVSEDKEHGVWNLNYPNGSIATFPVQRWADEYADEYNPTL